MLILILKANLQYSLYFNQGLLGKVSCTEILCKTKKRPVYLRIPPFKSQQHHTFEGQSFQALVMTGVTENGGMIASYPRET